MVERDWDGARKTAAPVVERGHGIGGALAAIASSPSVMGCTFRKNSAVAVFPPAASRGGGSSNQGDGGPGGSGKRQLVLEHPANSFLD